jgi:flagellar biosynthetic protein FlhB
MAEYSDPEERTEMPTDRRMGELRKKGQLFSSHEITMIVSMASGFLMLGLLWKSFFFDMQYTFLKAFQMIAQPEKLDTQMLMNGFFGLARLIAPDLLLLVGVVAIAASLTVLLQTDWNVRKKKFNFRWNLIDPIAGVRRIFSLNQIIVTLKALLKLTIILPLAYFALVSFAPDMVKLIHMSIPSVLNYSGETIIKLFWRILYILIPFAVFDYVWGKYQWLKNVKMTKDEVKDERKAMEGDEETKRKIQAKGLQRIMQRIRQSVPQADVVITNPTHYAVALKYERKVMNAPRVVAKGADFLAQRIKQLAAESGVPILERKVLARALYESTEVGAEIPHGLFKAVAEVLAYVYRLKNPWAYTRPQTEGGK